MAGKQDERLWFIDFQRSFTRESRRVLLCYLFSPFECYNIFADWRFSSNRAERMFIFPRLLKIQRKYVLDSGFVMKKCRRGPLYIFVRETVTILNATNQRANQNVLSQWIDYFTNWRLMPSLVVHNLKWNTVVNLGNLTFFTMFWFLLYFFIF